MRIMKLTQEEFDRLPGLLRLRVFCAWPGLNREGVAALVAGGMEVRLVGKERRYLKRELARVAGFRM
jgi:hypothetical protein